MVGIVGMTGRITHTPSFQLDDRLKCLVDNAVTSDLEQALDVETPESGSPAARLLDPILKAKGDAISEEGGDVAGLVDLTGFTTCHLYTSDPAAVPLDVDLDCCWIVLEKY